jgi:multiple sugar transport system permease protein
MYTYDMPRLMAASAMVAAPMIFLFIFTQKYFVRGIALTGIKG